MDYPEKGYPVKPCIDVYKEKIQSDGSIEKLKLIILVRGDLQNKEIIGDTWYPTASMSTMKYFLGDFLRINQEYTNCISLGYLYKTMSNIEFL